jgi:hypothetical protein
MESSVSYFTMGKETSRSMIDPSSDGSLANSAPAVKKGENDRLLYPRSPRSIRVTNRKPSLKGSAFPAFGTD